MKTMKKPIVNYLFIGIVLITVTSCGLLRKNVKNDIEENDNKEINDDTKIDKEALVVTDSLKRNSLSYKNFSASFEGSFESNDKKLPLKGIIRIKKDEFIWISLRPVLSIEIGRLVLTNDSIIYLDRLKNEYFAENYSYIKKNFGFEMNYSIIESALTNKFFMYPPGNTLAAYFLINNEGSETNTLNAAGIYSDTNLSHSIRFSGSYYYITENKIKFPDKNMYATFIYSDFKYLYGIKFPFNVNVNVFENSKKSNIEMNYSSISNNKEFGLNFKIPKNYKKIHFE